MNAPPALRIYITGFMGGGKSTIGPLLAARLGYEFVDIDALIEANEGKSVPEIFRERGEQDFRSLERHELGLLSTRDRIVVATGGGALTDQGSGEIIRGSGLLVYLQVPFEVLIARLRGRGGRPMIAADDGTPLGEDQLRERISSLLRTREPLYRKADVIVDAGSQSPGDTVSAILKSLGGLPGSR
ncbi:MAG TPA: shikimate kinase [Bacteroidota bacterium]